MPHGTIMWRVLVAVRETIRQPAALESCASCTRSLFLQRGNADLGHVHECRLWLLAFGRTALDMPSTCRYLAPLPRDHVLQTLSGIQLRSRCTFGIGHRILSSAI